jgi:hypothetical protein
VSRLYQWLPRLHKEANITHTQNADNMLQDKHKLTMARPKPLGMQSLDTEVLEPYRPSLLLAAVPSSLRRAWLAKTSLRHNSKEASRHSRPLGSLFNQSTSTPRVLDSSNSLRSNSRWAQ